MAIVGFAQIPKYDTLTSLLAATGVLGDYSYAVDVKQYFSWNGSGWKPMGSANPAPPTAVAGTGAGTGANIQLYGTNSDGYITLTQGTGGAAGGQIMVLTLANGVTYPTKMTITFSAANANFASLEALLYVTTTANTATLQFTGLALTAGNVYAGYYHIGGY